MEVVDVETNLKKVLKTIPSTVQLVAVSKFRPIEYIEIAYKMGQRCFETESPKFTKGYKMAFYRTFTTK